MHRPTDHQQIRTFGPQAVNDGLAIRGGIAEK